MAITGGDPQMNSFVDSMHIGTAPIALANWANNTYLGVVIQGQVDAGENPPGMVFGSNKPFPANMTIPDTTVTFDATKNCTALPGLVFNMAMCGLGGAAGDTILPPGNYGDWIISSATRIYLTSGTYNFRSLRILSDGAFMLFIQPGNALTRVLIEGNLTVGSGINTIAPTRYTDPSLKTGSVILYCNGVVSLGDDNRVWATVIAPRTNVFVESGLRLYGQIFGKSITVENGFRGGVGFGRFMPLKVNKGGFKYSVIQYQYKD